MVGAQIERNGGSSQKVMARTNRSPTNSQMARQDLDQTCAELDPEPHNSQKVRGKVGPIGGWSHAIWDNSQMGRPWMDGLVGEVQQPRS